MSDSTIAPRLPFHGKKGSYTVVYRVLLRVRDGAYVTEIARQLGITHKRVRRIVQKCVDLGYLELVFYEAFKKYKLTPQGEEFLVLCKKLAFQAKTAPSSICVSDSPFRTHSLRYKLKILRQNPTADFSGEFQFSKKNPRNWTGFCFMLTFPTAMTIEVNPEFVVVNFHEFQSRPNEFLNTVFNVVWRGLFCVHAHFQKKYDILLDVSSPEWINAHIANERPDLNDKLPKSSVVSVDLERKAQFIFPGDLGAKAWFDRSKGGGRPELETNDLLYAEKLLLMPETVDRLFRELAPAVDTNSVQVAEFARQLALHLAAIEGIKAGVEAEGRAVCELRDAVRELRSAKNTHDMQDTGAWVGYG